MIVVIDFRNICKISSYSVLSGSVACAFPLETEEIAHRLAKRLFCIRLDYPDAELIFANDRPPYWRARYINNWYSERGLEPVPYKGNRAGMPWMFKSTPQELNEVYSIVMKDMADTLEATVIEADELEADDIWGIISNYFISDAIIGVSSDSDWRQCLNSDTVKNRPVAIRKIYDPSTGLVHTEAEDIMPKIISGDRSDNIKGCPKLKKDGTDSGKFWGEDGAKKLLIKHTINGIVTLPPDLDKDTLERNRILITLPCPLWDRLECIDAIKDCVKLPDNTRDAIEIFNRYGLTVNVRELLQTKANRDAYIAKLRAHLQVENEKKVVPIVEESPESSGVLPTYEFYGFANSWGDTEPERVVNCMNAKHIKRHVSNGKGSTQVTCDICNYGYCVDSSD